MFTGIAYGLWIAALAALAVVAVPATAAAVSIIDCGNGQVNDLDMLATVGKPGGGTGDKAERGVALSIVNRTGSDLTDVEARQALDGPLAGTSIVRSPEATLGSVEYDSKGLMWEGDLDSGQSADITYAVTVSGKAAEPGGFHKLRPGSRFTTTISSSAAQCT